MNASDSPKLPPVVAPVVLLAAALVIGLFDWRNSGPLWPDAPRYANGAAMMRDWFAEGMRQSPVQHAQENYARYPAFSVPFHPPGYPAALGAWFLLFGESYLSARLFIALCWAVTGWLFTVLQRDLGANRLVALLGGLLLLTTPQLAIWSRDTMSEVPSMVPLMAAAICWNRWLRGDGRGYGLAALALAEAAFFCRVTTAGVIPGLVMFGLLSGQLPRRRWPGVAVFGGMYLVMNVAWVKFAAKYASHEMVADGKGQISFQHVFEYFARCGGEIFLSGTVAVGLLGLMRAFGSLERRKVALFWVCWFGSYLAFKAVVSTTFEPRHFATALPAFAGLAAILGMRNRATSTLNTPPCDPTSPPPAAKRGDLSPTGRGEVSLQTSIAEPQPHSSPLPAGGRPTVERSETGGWGDWSRLLEVTAIVLLALGIVANLIIFRVTYHPGLVGYPAVAKVVAESPRPGNVLLATWEDQDWIFHFRCAQPQRQRYCLRADRTLAIRVSNYAKKEAEVLGRTPADVLALLRDGRVGYVVTCTPAENTADVRPDEMKLVHETMTTHPQLVRRIGEFPVSVNYEPTMNPFGGTVHVWEVIAPVEEGPPNLSIVVPTAGMNWKP